LETPQAIESSEEAPSFLPSPKGSSVAFLIPAFNAASLLPGVLSELERAQLAAGLNLPVVVVDDGSLDRTAEVANEAGAFVISHERNRGKGAALQTGLGWAFEQKVSALVTLDADGQHPATEAVRLAQHPVSEEALVLGIRDLRAAGAPRANQRSNAFSNFMLSLFSGEKLLDTQCGLRRYPVAKIRALGADSSGFAFECDVALRAARRGVPLLQLPIEVLYPPEDQRVTHFDSVRDPTRIVLRVLRTALWIPHHRWPRRWGRRLIYLVLFFPVIWFLFQ